MNEEQTQKISLSILKELFKNTLRIFGVVWKEKMALVIIMGVIYLFLSLFSFAQSGAMALLINELVKVAGVGFLGGRVLFFSRSCSYCRIYSPNFEYSRSLF